MWEDKAVRLLGSFSLRFAADATGLGVRIGEVRCRDDWSERGGEKPLLQLAVVGKPGGWWRDEGEGTETDVRIPTSTSNQTPLQRPLMVEAKGEGG